MPSVVKALIMWLVLLVAMVVNGIVRVRILEPRLGEPIARQVGCLIGIGIILALTAFFVRGLDAPSSAMLLGIGVLWLVLTLAFELLLGNVSGVSLETQLDDYDVLEGRLWPFVLLTTLLAPWFCGVVTCRAWMR